MLSKKKDRKVKTPIHNKDRRRVSVLTDCSVCGMLKQGDYYAKASTKKLKVEYKTENRPPSFCHILTKLSKFDKLLVREMIPCRK